MDFTISAADDFAAYQAHSIANNFNSMALRSDPPPPWQVLPPSTQNFSLGPRVTISPGQYYPGAIAYRELFPDQPPIGHLLHYGPISSDSTGSTHQPQIYFPTNRNPGSAMPSSRQTRRRTGNARRLTKEHRRQYLHNDEWVSSFNKERVICANCWQPIKLDNRDRAEYYLQNWKKHRRRCVGH